MGSPWTLTLSTVMLTLVLPLSCGDNGDVITVKFLKAPPAFSSSKSASFVFEVLERSNGVTCRNCGVKCKLDNHSSEDCQSKQISYTALLDGFHTFEVCTSGSGSSCASYSWTIDTIPPTASISVASAFTNASIVPVDISFSEPCIGGGGFQCSTNDCNLLVYGAGSVVPRTLKVIQPDIRYSLDVAISAEVQYGRLVLVMDRDFCTDASGNRFTRTTNSSFFLHFDRRTVSVNVRTPIPEKLLLVDNKMRTVEATNDHHNLRIYLQFSAPVLNSSSEILSSLQTSSGVLSSTNRPTLGNRRFGFLIQNLTSIAIVSISLASSSIISRQGTPVSTVEPTTFLYDVERPTVRLSTSNLRTRKHSLPVIITFEKPVFDFDSSTILISGGQLQGFRKLSRSLYAVEIQISDRIISIRIPENIARDVAGNRNLESNLLQVRHYSMPTISFVFSLVTTATFLATSFASAFLSISTESLLSLGALSAPSSFASDPSRNLMRIAYHVQVIAQSRWLTFSLPIEYYEFTRGVGWIIPYLSLPWETKDAHSFPGDSSSQSVGAFSETSEASKLHDLGVFPSQRWNFFKGTPHYGMPFSPMEYQYGAGAPLTAMEYMTFFENQNMKPEAEYIQISRGSDRWKYFGRNMFWLSVIGGGLMVIHLIILFILKSRQKNSEKNNRHGALAFPRFEIFLIFLALPCVCQASASIIKAGATSGIVVGSLLLVITSILLALLLVFISFGITRGKLLQYKEVHREGEKLHWYQGLTRAFLGPGKRGQWTWKDQPDSVNLIRLGPLFEDLRGPPKYMLSQIGSRGANGGKRTERIIASDDETEDAEAPFIQRLFGILRIYYTFLESLKRICLGIVVGVLSAGNSLSKLPTILVLSIASFQLFFLMLKKPFIKKKVQLVELVSLASEVGIFTTCLVLFDRDFTESGETRLGYFMLALFMVGYLVQLTNQWYALYRQVLRLSPDENSFYTGLRKATLGFLLVFLPKSLLSGLDERVSSNDTGSVVSSGSRSGGNERSWIRQLREIAKESFSRDDRKVPKDPSSSQMGGGITSVSSSADFKEKAKEKSSSLQKDLEAIFSEK